MAKRLQWVVVAAVYVAACLGAVACGAHQEPVVRSDAATLSIPECEQGHVPRGCTERLIPRAEDLPDWMKKPPCDAEMDEVEIRGKCWQATSREIPCGRLYRWERRCFRPIDGGKDKK